MSPSAVVPLLQGRSAAALMQMAESPLVALDGGCLGRLLGHGVLASLRAASCVAQRSPDNAMCSAVRLRSHWGPTIPHQPQIR